MNHHDRLQELLRIGALMAETTDQDVLLERILSEARRFCNADAGSIYQVEEGRLHFRYSQNDTLQRRLPPGKKLPYTAFSVPIDHTSIAGYAAATGEMLDIPDAYALDPNLPYHFSSSFDLQAGYHTASMLTIPLRTSRDQTLGVLQLLNARNIADETVPFPSDEFPLVKHLANQAANALEKTELTRAIILRMIRMAEMRDPKETGAHVNRVGAFSAALWVAWATKHAIPELERERKRDLLRLAAMLHDVGKVAISDTILKKPAKLTDEEFATMKHHTFLGAQLFYECKSELDEVSAEIALYHHESWNGRGYPGKIDPYTGRPPNGSEGPAVGYLADETPLWGRIVKIADVYDALSRPRVYKAAWTQEDVIAELLRGRGTDFDPELVDIFLEIMDEIQTISARHPDVE
jgi:HD-GYP domain-containing protein (c-di-GMP phosphodiesterase class II)